MIDEGARSDSAAASAARTTIVSALREIAVRLRMAGDGRFRALAYQRGADALEAMSDEELARRIATETLTDVAGIGPALATVVREVARSGTAAVLERLRASSPAALLELTRVPGITQ